MIQLNTLLASVPYVGRVKLGTGGRLGGKTVGANYAADPGGAVPF